MSSILFFVCLFLICVIIVLAAVLFEVKDHPIAIYFRKWRIAFSKRRQINAVISDRKLAELKMQRSAKLQREAEEYSQTILRECGERLACMGSYIIAEQCGDHIKAIRANNYHAKEKKILKSIDVAEQNGYSLPRDERQQLARMLKQAHEKAMRIEAEKERQAEIKAQMREEERAHREAEKAVREAEKEARIKEKALQEALRMLGDEHSEAIARLKQELADAQERLVRTKSMAELTKSGHVYVISNVGSFGEGVFKVGMTRRLEPNDRVRELGDASVPFPFDVHAMISCDDAPSLENSLHKELHSFRVNKINLRKEFFRVDLARIVELVEQHHGAVEYEADPEALEYLETIALESDTEDVEDKLGVGD